MRSDFATHNQFAVSANARETAINTEHALDTLMKVDRETMPKITPRTEDDSDEATGYEEATALYDLGDLGAIPFKMSKAQPQHVAFLGAYGLGVDTPAAAGTTGYLHTITPIVGDLDDARSNPSFTAAGRFGKHLLKERLASCFVNTLNLNFQKDSWLQVEADIQSTGKRTSNMVEESVTAAYNATSLTLAANDVAGSDAPERLANVHAIRVQVPSTLEWVDVVYSAVDGSSPAVITIVAPGVPATSVTYKILYNIKETSTYAWADFTGLTLVSESPLKVTDFSVKVGGKWSGSAFLGGHSMDADINSLKWTLNNNIKPEFTPGAGSGDYANRCLREGRVQSIDFDRKFREYLIGNFSDTRETFGFYAIAEGKEYESGHKYTVKIVFPKVAVLTYDKKLDGKRLSEAVNFKVLEDATYGSVILIVKNKVAAYAA